MKDTTQLLVDAGELEERRPIDVPEGGFARGHGVVERSPRRPQGRRGEQLGLREQRTWAVSQRLAERPQSVAVVTLGREHVQSGGGAEQASKRGGGHSRALRELVERE